MLERIAKRLETTNRTAARRLSPHGGFTLIEVCLTMALLAAIAAFAWPTLGTAFVNQRLKQSASQLSSHLSKARVQAMRLGVKVKFVCEIGGSRYYWQATQTESTTEAGSNSSAQSLENSINQSNQPTTAANEKLDKTSVKSYEEQIREILALNPDLVRKLPPGVIFASNPIILDMQTAMADLQSGATQSSESGSGWSKPIYFYPDGTSSDAQLLLRNEKERSVSVALRGLTGVVTVSDLLAPGESP